MMPLVARMTRAAGEKVGKCPKARGVATSANGTTIAQRRSSVELMWYSTVYSTVHELVRTRREKHDGPAAHPLLIGPALCITYNTVTVQPPIQQVM